MTNEAIARKVIAVQEEFLKRLHCTDNKIEFSNAPTIVEQLFDSDPAFLEFSFGHLGQSLGSFIKTLDLNHPEITNVFDGALIDGTSFSKQFMEFLALSQYAYNSGITSIFPLLGDILLREICDKSFLKKIENNCNKCHVRLISSQLERDSVRLNKKMQVIDLQNIYKKNADVWKMQPDDFLPFLRFDSVYSNEIAKAEKKMRRYQELGCITLANEIAKSIQNFRDNMEQSYYGFNRITMTNAAVILAKLHGFSYTPSQSVYAGGFYTNTDPQIHVYNSFFNNYNFDPTNALSAMYSNLYSRYVYEPKVYPFYELKELASDQLLNIINKLENFPEANGKPLFDHYGVIVPSFSYNLLYINDESGVIQNFTSAIEASRALDKILIRKKLIFPIVVGERDGKCFFICHWN